MGACKEWQQGREVLHVFVFQTSKKCSALQNFTLLLKIIESKYRKYVFCEAVQLHNALCKHFHVSKGLSEKLVAHRVKLLNKNGNTIHSHTAVNCCTLLSLELPGKHHSF